MIVSMLMQEALAPLNGNYTATGMPFQGIVVLPSASGSVEMSLKQIAAQAWATEMALLHASGMTAEAQADNRYLLFALRALPSSPATASSSLPAMPIILMTFRALLLLSTCPPDESQVVVKPARAGFTLSLTFHQMQSSKGHAGAVQLSEQESEMAKDVSCAGSKLAPS